MDFSLWTYQSIKNMIVGRKISFQALEELKESFSGEIGSKRRVSCIRNLADLLDVLERKDVINPANIGVLEDICYILGNRDLIDAISHYKPEEEYGLENEYALERIENEMQEKVPVEHVNRRMRPKGRFEDNIGVQPINSTPAALVLSGKKRDKVYDLIATEIGRKWRDFGRGIHMREGEMDNLETDYPRNSKEKVQKMLELFEADEKVEPKKIVTCICTSLNKCRRADLSDKIQDILTR